VGEIVLSGFGNMWSAQGKKRYSKMLSFCFHLGKYKVLTKNLTTVKWD